MERIRTFTGLPRLNRGFSSQEKKDIYQLDLESFCNRIKVIKSTIDFPVSSRGWCYILEGLNIINKGEFAACATTINDCRKSGLLPINICSEDEARSVQVLNEWFDNLSSEEFAQNALNNIDPPGFEQHYEYVNRYYNYLNRYARSCASDYHPFTYRDFQDNYIEMVVEKIDLIGIFEPVCKKYSIPIGNNVGWKDINSRYQLMLRFKEWEDKGKQCILLYCGDHDPGGLLISDTFRKNLEDLSKAANWIPDKLHIDRFGLNFDFIEKYKLSWIDNLISGSGEDLAHPRPTKKNPDPKPAKYVQEYIDKYGERKCEANALLTNIETGRELCEQAIKRYYDDEGDRKYSQETNRVQNEVFKAIQETIEARKDEFEPDEIEEE